MTELDAVVVGAGFSGLYMLHRLRDTLGLSARVVEAADDVGGTWYWNRYPGARCDSESYFYSFSDRLSPELNEEWTWTERFAGQPEILNYLQTVAERFDLRRDIRFGTRVTGAAWDDDASRWTVSTDDGEQVSARFLITAVGCLSTTNLPEFPGRDGFAGDWYHTGRWPHGGVDFTGKRVAVIGTGATAVQCVPEIAEQADHVHVLQRTANYDIAGGNHPITAEDDRRIKDDYTAIWARTRESSLGFPYEVSDRPARSVSDGERQEIFEEAWARGGFRLATTFNDLLLDADANETAAEFLRSKIRERVHDPEVAELLAPSDHPFFTKRPPLENGYYETFNRENVTLVDVRRHPIREINADRPADRRGHLRGRQHRLRHRVRRDDRHPVHPRHHGARRSIAAGRVGGGAADVPGPDDPRVPEPVRDHRAAESLGAVEHAGVEVVLVLLVVKYSAGDLH